jgi:hypothetical protein
VKGSDDLAGSVFDEPVLAALGQPGRFLKLLLGFIVIVINCHTLPPKKLAKELPYFSHTAIIHLMYTNC